jgi:hypothetical protein
MAKASDIAYECGAHWVLRVKNGFEVYRVNVTHSVRVGGFYGIPNAFGRAIAFCKMREAAISLR